jgi:hypothetical protein
LEASSTACGTDLPYVGSGEGALAAKSLADGAKAVRDSAILSALFGDAYFPRIPARRWLGWFFLVFGLTPRIGQAAVVDAGVDCPRGADVDAALSQLLGANPNRPPIPAVAVRDFGTTWSVEIAGRSATYTEPNRDCAERTKVAAVFAALVLEPPDLGDAPAAPAPPLATVPTQPRLNRYHRLDIAPEFLVAPGAGQRGSTRTWGGSLRWLWIGEHAGFTVGLGASYPSDAALRGYELSLARVSFDTSPCFSWRLGPAEFGIEAGPYVALLLAHGVGLHTNASSTHTDAGGRLGFYAQTTGRRVSPFVGLQAEVSGRHFSVVVDPSGPIGTAPRIWLGVLAGASISLGHRH